VGFELTIAASERATTVHALDRAATVIGDDVNLLGDSIDTIKKNTTLIDAGKEVSLELNSKIISTSTCCGLVTKMQGKIMTCRQLTNPLKTWHTSNIWDR
jgi:hypothetical protein